MDEILDLHVYTNNSVCGHDKVSFLCETAVEKEIRGVAFTDLCRVDAPEDYDMHRRLRHSYFDICKAKLLFFGAVSVFAGIEFEQAVAAPALAADILSRQRYDIVLTAVGRNRDGSPFGLTPETDPAAFRAFADSYAAMLCETIETTDFDVLSRPVAPLRQCGAAPDYFESAMREPLSDANDQMRNDTERVPIFMPTGSWPSRPGTSRSSGETSGNGRLISEMLNRWLSTWPSMVMVGALIASSSPPS